MFGMSFGLPLKQIQKANYRKNIEHLLNTGKEKMEKSDLVAISITYKNIDYIYPSTSQSGH